MYHDIIEQAMAAGRSKPRDAEDERVKNATFADYEALKENLGHLTSERNNLQSQISGLAAENKSLLGKSILIYRYE